MARGRAQVLPILLSRIERGKKLLLAVSGGVDSMVLLHGCVQIARQRALVIEVAHLDHALRRESATDAKFVKQRAKQYGVRFHLARAVPPKKRTNLEEWGRKARYVFFEKVRKKRKLDLILTAHHANDLAETLLMRMLTNKESHLIAAADPARHILRPMLEISRAEIERYAEAERLSWREDPSNLSDQFLRNRIRNKLVPFLEREFDPRIIEVLANRGLGVAEDQELLYSISRNAVATLGRHPFGSESWLKAAHAQLGKLPAGISWRVVEDLLLGKLGFRIGRRHAQSVLSVLEYETIGCELPAGWRIIRGKGRLVIKCSEIGKPRRFSMSKGSSINKPGRRKSVQSKRNVNAF